MKKILLAAALTLLVAGCTAKPAAQNPAPANQNTNPAAPTQNVPGATNTTATAPTKADLEVNPLKVGQLAVTDGKIDKIVTVSMILQDGKKMWKVEGTKSGAKVTVIYDTKTGDWQK